MIKLVPTTRWGIGRAAHHHIVYLNDEKGIGACGTERGHTHEVQWIEPTEDQQDQETGEVAPGEPGYFQFMPDATDGHTHEIEDSYEVSEESDDEDDTVKLSEVISLFKAASEIEGESLLDGVQSDEFYSGKQWTDGEKTTLETLDRACLTINLIGPKIDEIDGHQRQSRTDIHYLPIEGGDQRTCDLYNAVTKIILEQSFYGREKSKAFLDSVITGRGWYTLFLDRSKNIFGDLKIQRYPYKQVRCGEHEQEDLSDCEYLIKDRVYSKAKIQQLWPDKADDIQKNFKELTDSRERITQYAVDHYAKADGARVLMGSNVLVDVAKKEFRVIECQRKMYIQTSVGANADDDVALSLYGWDQKDVKQVGTIPGFSVITRAMPKIRITKVAGGVVLSDEKPAELPVDDFFMVPIYAYKRGERFWGKVQGAKDPQREINKRRSHAIDSINRAGSSGWAYDEETFPDMAEAERFKKNVTTPGHVTKVNDVNRLPARIPGQEFPTALIELMKMDQENLDRLLNISIREPGANTSAAAIMQAQKLKLVGNEFLFDNLSFAEQHLGKLILHSIRKYYSSERIYRMVSNRNQKSPVSVGGTPFEEFSKEEIISILDNAEVAELDVAVSEASYSPTMRLGILMMLQDWAKAGGSVPPKLFVKYLDVPEEERQEMQADIEAQAQAATEQGQQTEKMEITKTLVAKGILTPEVRQKYLGEQPPQEQQTQAPNESIPAEAPQGVSEF